MPTYQYRCTECGDDLEAVQKFTDAALTECPNCGGPLRKIFNAVGVVFKGSGFYRTDSRAKASDGDANGSAKSESSNGSEKSDSGGTEKTPDKAGAAAKSESAKSESAKSESAKSESAKPANSGGTKQSAPAGSSSTGRAS